MLFKLVDEEVWSNFPEEIKECLGEGKALICQLFGGIDDFIANGLIEVLTTNLTKGCGLLLMIDSHGGDVGNMERIRVALSMVRVNKAAWVVSRAHGACFELLVTAFPKECRFASPEASFVIGSCFADLEYRGRVDASIGRIDGLSREGWRAKTQAWFEDSLESQDRKIKELWEPIFADEAKRLQISVPEYLAMGLEISSLKALELGLIGKILPRRPIP